MNGSRYPVHVGWLVTLKEPSRSPQRGFIGASLECGRVEPPTLLHERDAMSDATPRPIASRRTFIRQGVAAAVTLPTVAATLAACGETKATVPPPKDSQGAAPPPPSPRQKADEMDAMHEKGIKAFPAKTEGKGNQLLEPRMEGRVKVYELTAEEMQWEVEPGKRVEAWAYNGQVPGPQIRVREGDRVRDRAQERAPRVHRDPLPRPRAAERPGRRAVHHPAADQAGRDLHLRVHGAERRLAHVPLAPQRGRSRWVSGCSARSSSSRSGRAPIEKVDVDYVMILNDGVHGYTFNGKSFPATEPIVAKLGPEGPHPLHERGDDDPPDAPARDAHDGDRQGRLAAAGAVEVRHAEHRARASGGT